MRVVNKGTPLDDDTIIDLFDELQQACTQLKTDQYVEAQSTEADLYLMYKEIEELKQQLKELKQDKEALKAEAQQVNALKAELQEARSTIDEMKGDVDALYNRFKSLVKTVVPVPAVVGTPPKHPDS